MRKIVLLVAALTSVGAAAPVKNAQAIVDGNKLLEICEWDDWRHLPAAMIMSTAFRSAFPGRKD
jgi:hypothetical protein